MISARRIGEDRPAPGRHTPVTIEPLPRLQIERRVSIEAKERLIGLVAAIANNQLARLLSGLAFQLTALFRDRPLALGNGRTRLRMLREKTGTARNCPRESGGHSSSC